MHIIDAYSHVLPRTYYEALNERSGGTHAVAELLEAIPALMDVDERLALMDRHDIDEQVLVPATPAVETVADRLGAAQLARTANDGIAEIVAAHPNRFHGVATVAMNNPEAMVAELDRAINDLGLVGVLLYSSVDDRPATDAHIEAAGRPIDRPEFDPFYERVSELDVPIWLHPGRPKTNPDYVGELESKYLVWQMFGWPFELSAAMARLVFSGVLTRHNLTVIAHHAGGMVPLLGARMNVHYDLFEMAGDAVSESVPKPYAEAFRRFYADTVTFGSAPALRTAYEFFGPEQLLFGTDSPFDSEGGDRSIATNRRGIADLDVTDADRERLLSGNVRDLLG